MQKLGMHRDGKKWNLPEEEAIERRRIFWEIESMDCWQAMGYGRPPSLVRPHFDTTQPFDTEESLGHAPQFFRLVTRSTYSFDSPICAALIRCTVGNTITSQKVS